MKNTNFGWDNKKIILTHWKTLFWVTDKFCIKWTFWKNAFFCPKNAFFWRKWQFNPLASAGQQRFQETFFPMVFFYLYSEGFFGARWGTCRNPPLNIFNLAKNGPFMKDLRKKVSKSDWKHIHKLHVTQIHHYIWFLNTFLLKMSQFQ